ncbi:hypothetical protein QUB80_02070 [Chlorogloeopsis sp. ULAP01]|uniref:hypothetical protein n=1 Tax=Chlorogloeopsis sp. ULAP01 TaxID=3056483 RepID=UPI0025AA8972|nr:hypothetical protein [Chlorogloeopsis sp. ULAP01]MDM9379487.1 hypothetical protein [Chlorogloeopsis sp. ULAP01]
MQFLCCKNFQKLFCLSIFLIGVVVFSSPSYAGGASWKVVVEGVDNLSQTSAVITLKTVESWYPKCTVMTILAEYRPEPLWEQTWSKNMVTQAKHLKALEYLHHAHVQSQVIRFGEIGTGLVSQEISEHWLSKLMSLLSSVFGFGKNSNLKQPDLSRTPSCTFKSRGLAILDEHEGTQAVYSFYGRV